MKRPKKFYLKERHNPQLGVYWIRVGQISASEARQMEESAYGYNIMRPFETEEAYSAEITRLKEDGKNVQ